MKLLRGVLEGDGFLKRVPYVKGIRVQSVWLIKVIIVRV